jgi:hypothetical protein
VQPRRRALALGCAHGVTRGIGGDSVNFATTYTLTPAQVITSP